MVESRFLRQETNVDRGKNTCYPTSIINAAIAIGVVSPEHAKLFQDAIVEDLIAVSDLWDGSFIHINTDDSRIAEVIEDYFPGMRIGSDEEGMRLMLVERNFGHIWRDLVTGVCAHVIIVKELSHSYAIIGARIENGENAVSYVDPLDPKTTHIGNQKWFSEVFRPDSNGNVKTTIVKKKDPLL